MRCFFVFVFFLMIRRPPRSTQGGSSAASEVYKRQDHGVIGDSAKEPPLSSIVLEWMLDGAKGLKLKRGVKFSTTPSNPLYPLDRLTKKCKLFKKWWEGPMSDWELYPSTRKHVNALATYRPKSLHKIF